MRLKPIISAYALFILLWFLVYWVWQDQWWLFTLLDALGVPLFWPAIPLLVLALLLRSTRHIYLAIAPVLIFFFFFYASLKPTIIPKYERADLRISTYNIL
ncbi:MAG: hypothetical protein AAFN08_18440, partial [Cyanobacteria bacterium J06559_3]